jgi:formate--tetrahydrofolate ligase
MVDQEDRPDDVRRRWDHNPAPVRAKIHKARSLGYAELPICMAKTQDSLSDNPKLQSPRGFTVTVRDPEIAAGAGFLVALTGEIVRMPGLPERPAAERIDVDASGLIQGLS